MAACATVQNPIPLRFLKSDECMGFFAFGLVTYPTIRLFVPILVAPQTLSLELRCVPVRSICSTLTLPLVMRFKSHAMLFLSIDAF